MFFARVLSKYKLVLPTASESRRVIARESMPREIAKPSTIIIAALPIVHSRILDCSFNSSNILWADPFFPVNRGERRIIRRLVHRVDRSSILDHHLDLDRTDISPGSGIGRRRKIYRPSGSVKIRELEPRYAKARSG